MRSAPLVVAALAVLANSAQLMAQAPSPASGEPALDWAMERSRTGQPEVVDIDLANFPEGGAVTRGVTPGGVVILEVKRRPRGSALRIVIEGGGGARTQHDFPPLTAPEFPPGLPPECVPLRSAIESLIAARRVREADAAERLVNQIDIRGCPQLKAAVQGAFGKGHPFLAIGRQVHSGGRVQITIEQLAPDGGVAATWAVTLQPVSLDQPWAHANEQEWLAAAIVRDISGLLAHSARSAAPPQTVVRTVRQLPTGSAVVNASVTLAGRPTVSQEIPLDPHVFDPRAYVPYARATAASLGSRPSMPEASIGLPARLLQPHPAVLKRESKRVAQWLTRRPLDPSANEEAALIHLALALRESAGAFTDVRASVARATAHLALAGLATRTPSASGRIAAAALQALIGRQAEVLPRLNAMLSATVTPPEEKAWARALGLRVTGDWRIAPKATRLSLLERLALFRAQRRALGGLHALDLFELQKPEPVADWAWMALSGPFTVDEGNMFAGGAFAATVSEMSDVLFEKADGAAEPAEVSAALRANLAEGAAIWNESGATIRILDPALWTAFFSRHLAHSAQAAEVHYHKMQGTPDAADGFAAQVEPYLAETPWLFALAAMRDPVARGSRSGSPACGPFVAWVRRQPQSVPAIVWHKLMSPCPLVSPMTQWFAGPVIPGTVLGLAERKDTMAMMTLDSLFPRLRALAPLDEDLATLFVVWAPKKADSATIKEAFGARKDYSLAVMRRLEGAAGVPPEERRVVLEKMCELSADECGRLGHLLKEDGKTAAAVMAFERELSGARDRVRMSFDMDWLALHYLDSGKADDAERVARAAAATYSAGGLALLGRVLDRRGRLPEAESVFKAIETRYRDRRQLDLFLLRAQRRPGGERYKEEAGRVMERIFPGGLERVTVEAFHGPPTEGVEILHDSSGIKQLGLAKGDVIVAFDGYRTRNFRQYQVVREMSEDPAIRLLAWSASRKAYVTASAQLLDRRTGSDLRTYPYRPGVE